MGNHGIAALTSEIFWRDQQCQGLRSASQALPSREGAGLSLATELAFELIDGELPIMSLALQHTKGAQAAGDVMPLRPLRAGLTARQGQLIRAHPEHLFNLGPHALEPPYLRSQQRQAIGGVVLLAVSDTKHFEAPIQPAAVGPIGVPPMLPEGVPMEPAILFETADERPPIVANPLEEGSGGIPRVKKHTVRVAAQAIAGRAAPRAGEDIR